MKFTEFLEFTPKEFNRLLEIRGDKDFTEYKRDMERMRLQTFVLASVHFDKKSQNKYKTPKSIMPFDWDNKGVKKISPQPTEDEYKKMDKISAGGKRK